MTFFNNMRILIKLPVMIGLLCIGSLMSFTIFSYYSARSVIETRAKSNLLGLAQERRMLLEETFQTLNLTAIQLAESEIATVAASKLQMGWESLPKGREDYVQNWYIDQSPYEEGDRGQLASATDGSIFSQFHRRFHGFFLSQLNINGLHDIFMLNQNGDMIYSVQKYGDFGSNITENTTLAAMHAEARNLGAKRQIFETPFIKYNAYGADWAKFILTPIVNANDEIVGTLGVSFTQDHLDDIIAVPKTLEGGEIHLIGPTISLGGHLPGGMDDIGIGENDLGHPPYSLDQEAQVQTRNGDQFFMAHQELDWQSKPWRVEVLQSSSVIAAPIETLKNKLLLNLIGYGGCVILLAFALGRNIGRPLSRVKSAMFEVAHKRYDTVIPDLHRKDEIGEIAQVLQQFKTDLQIGEEATTDAVFKGAAFESSTAAMALIDLNGDILYANDSLKGLWAVYREQLKEIWPNFDIDAPVGQTVIGLGCEPRFIHLIENCQSSHRKGSGNIVHEEIYLSLKLVAIEDADGVVAGYSIEWNDESRARGDRAALEAIELTRVTAEFTAAGRFLRMNENFQSLIDGSTEYLENLSASEVFFPADQNAPNLDICFMGKQATSGIYEARFTNKIIVLDGTFMPVLDSANNCFKVIFVGRDETETIGRIKRSEEARVKLSQEQGHVVNELSKALDTLSTGDLGVEIIHPFNDAHEELRHDFNLAVQTLNETMRHIVENAGLINRESSDIGAASESLAARAKTQSETLEETASSLGELTLSMQSIATGANEVRQTVSSAQDLAKESQSTVTSAVQAMEEIETSSRAISKIVTVIDDIAFQTNLLALNAGVEAARAGDAGRGFAVVASEVRALAARSSEAAKDITDLIESSDRNVKHGVRLVGQAGGALTTILDAVENISHQVRDITNSQEEQSLSLNEINAAITALDLATQENSVMISQTANASMSLRQEAEVMFKSVARFKIDKDALSEEDAGLPMSAIPLSNLPKAG
ncbi:MAG: methyl-accepting chemotaxis protein [Halocynthiibacter sp.]